MGILALKSFVGKLTGVIFAALFVPFILMAILDGDPFTLWDRFAFAGLLLVALGINGFTLAPAGAFTCSPGRKGMITTHGFDWTRRTS
jgi:hypothetical protein